MLGSYSVNDKLTMVRYSRVCRLQDRTERNFESMLQLKNIVKNYKLAGEDVPALRGIDIEFRENEFVSILGPSGCGKTTLLNIIGGLDRYTSGDLNINGRSTKEYKDRDWDTYRNRSIGFVFQTYNLISHQTALSNVELALTLSGVSKTERRKRAVEALNKVGLSDQLKKKPNQMSGGQMQRVAIARALVNNPDILLADEPTGALDTETSLQIMILLKEIAHDRLVIMVTHNPDLANEYSTRIVKLLDGQVIGDSNPYDSKDEKKKESKAAGKKQKTSMSFGTALSLSFNNLITKKARTFLTSFAGSIGIIGIALILSLQSGVQAYISNVESDALSTYPLVIEDQSMDMEAMMTLMMDVGSRNHAPHELDKVYSNDIMTDMIKTFSEQQKKNDLAEFKRFLESGESDILSLTNSIQYGYSIKPQIYKANTAEGVLRVNPSKVFEEMGMGQMMSMPGAESMSAMQGMGGAGLSVNVWTELLGNQALLDAQYDVIAGGWPQNFNEVVLVVNERNEISDMTLYSLGLKDQDEIEEMMKDLMSGKAAATTASSSTYTYDELMALTFKLVMNTDYFTKTDGVWQDKREDVVFLKRLVDDSLDLKVVGIVRPSEESVSGSISGTVGYTSALTEYVISQANDSEIVKEQLANPDINVFTGKSFSDKTAQVDLSALTPEEQAYLASLSEEERAAVLASGSESANDTYDRNLSQFGYVDREKPSSIRLYPIDFDSKEAVSQIIANYNQRQKDAGHEEFVINYSDMVKLLMSSVTSIIDVISYVLIAFVAISLVVSSIMIGIITYISVLERTKEIGILRSIGASKRDISSVFNAETLVIGLVSGAIGILTTLLLSLPINAIIKSIAGISGVSALPPLGAVILVALSMMLTVIAGLIPSRIAAKKDPVVALRTE